MIWNYYEGNVAQSIKYIYNSMLGNNSNIITTVSICLESVYDMLDTILRVYTTDFPQNSIILFLAPF